MGTVAHGNQPTRLNAFPLHAATPPGLARFTRPPSPWRPPPWRASRARPPGGRSRAPGAACCTPAAAEARLQLVGMRCSAFKAFGKAGEGVVGCNALVHMALFVLFLSTCSAQRQAGRRHECTTIRVVIRHASNKQPLKRVCLLFHPSTGRISNPPGSDAGACHLFCYSTPPARSPWPPSSPR